MVCVTLPAAERAEQNVAGHHTARRPNSWARPGLGYRLPELDDVVPDRRMTLTGLMHRYVLPRGLSRRLAAHRESGRVDYRIGHLPPEERVVQVRRLTADGLAAHVATLLAVATYDEDDRVLDALADEVAARQWEPVVNDRVAAVRLWARGWLAARQCVPATSRDDVVGAAPADDDVRVIDTPSRRPVPAPARRRRTTPRSFARTTAVDTRPEDLR
jgi:carbamoyl-phosphate synthase large subunit